MSIVIHTARTIVTMDPARPVVEAVAVDGERIAAVGTLAEVLDAVGQADHVVDETFADHVVLPGLIDQHLHPILGASTLATEVIATEDWVLPDRTFPAAHSHDEYVASLRAAELRTRRSGTAGDDWLFSWGYHPLWHGELGRDLLDTISDDRPIGVWHRSCHEFHLNTVGLRVLGLLGDAWRADVADDVLETADVDTGHFWERGFFVAVFPRVSPMLFTPERLSQGLRQMVRSLHQNGVTAFNEPGAILPPGAWDLYREVLGHPDTPFFSFFLTDGRGPAESGMSHDDTLARATRQYEMSPDRSSAATRLAFFPKQAKLFADGAIISQLMQMREPYLDRHGAPNPDHRGEWIMPPEMFDERAELYWRAGFQLHVHVNGDLGLDLVLDTVERRLRDQPRHDHRTVIVHFANSTEEQVDRIADLGCIVSSNPYYPVGFADKFGEVGLGPDRADVMVRHRSVLDRGIPLSFHSDLPMGPSDPIGMMSCAVNRITQSGRVAGPEQRIGVEAALRAVTIDAAHSWRKESDLGSIEVGKIASFTVVDRNPLDVDPLRLDDIEVVGTVFCGRWFPLPAGVSRRTSHAGAATPIAPTVDAAWRDHAGCVCDVAREAMRHVA